MKAPQLMAWLEEQDREFGSAMVDADTLAEAEEYVGRYPIDSHGFETSATIHTTVDRGKRMLADAGYAWSKDLRRWARGSFTASMSTPDGTEATIFIGTIKARGMTALATGPGGYLHPGDRPEV